MRRESFNKFVLESIWREFSDGIDEMKSEKVIAFRYLRCRYKLLLIMKEVTDDKVADFRHSVTEVKRLIECNQCV